MSEALVYHYKVSIKNFLKRSLRRPLKMIGMILAVAYFVFLPFLMKQMIVDMGFANPSGFVAIGTVFSLYVGMPVTLTYFKRNGVVFRKQDVNFMFATPLSPKQVLFYALFKQSYMNVLMQVAVVIAAIYVFNIPVATSLIFGCVNLVFSNLLQYSLALVLYGSERLSERVKRTVKWVVYVILAVVSGLILAYFVTRGFSVETALSLVSHPMILLVPIFGWELGWLNLMILGPTLVSSITTILFLVSSLFMAYTAYKMSCTGQYYEDALKYSQRVAKMEANKGSTSFSEMMGKKRKTYKFNAEIKGSFASVMFSRQFIERRRTRKLFLSIGDFIVLILGIVIAFLSRDTLDGVPIYFALVTGVTLYCGVFFAVSPTWKDEYATYFLFVIPDSMWRKLLYSTMLEHVLSLINASLLALSIGLVLGVSGVDIILAIIAQVSIKMMITYKAVLVDGFFGAKLGKAFAQIVSLIISMVLVIVPVIGAVVSATSNAAMGFVIVAPYAIILTFILMFFCTKVLTNIESLN